MSCATYSTCISPYKVNALYQIQPPQATFGVQENLISPHVVNTGREEPRVLTPLHSLAENVQYTEW